GHADRPSRRAGEVTGLPHAQGTAGGWVRRPRPGHVVLPAGLADLHAGGQRGRPATAGAGAARAAAPGRPGTGSRPPVGAGGRRGADPHVRAPGVGHPGRAVGGTAGTAVLHVRRSCPPVRPHRRRGPGPAAGHTVHRQGSQRPARHRRGARPAARGAPARLRGGGGGVRTRPRRRRGAGAGLPRPGDRRPEHLGAEVPARSLAGRGRPGGQGRRRPPVPRAGDRAGGRAAGQRHQNRSLRSEGFVTVRPLPFFSSGLRLDADLHLPGDGSQPPYPVVVACSGYLGQKVIHPERFARALNPLGYAVLAFDYRGFGASEGERGRAVPQEWVEDVRAAVDRLTVTEDVDPGRVGGGGWGLGGGVAISEAADDPRVKAVACLNGVADGARSTRNMHDQTSWEKLLARIEADRGRRATIGRSEITSPWDIVRLDLDDRTHRYVDAELYKTPGFGGGVTLESA